MELDKNKFALAAGATIGIWYVICATLVATVPDLATKLFSWMVHLIDLRAEVSFPEVIYGFIEVVIFAYITAYVFAWLHNRFMKIS
ncbi:hypothetical protein A3B05_03225 [Candidatus Giovannonibacteria bacterium RIFCSPLOWO2_01_FULL_43_160]|uniref:Uncharacterized protein n=2 Tax=Candidatus Giovannoniibacteriota TaxID=1752738 RepID=A0A0G1IWM4_9BACT|nr:MAG: hypothetical protein UV72_C0005G0026 [Candidatus Giovannonibacteria bacterium GW2011_GWB1_43_13]KKS99472.1 MAG: hypothetical protein UV75_C0004G0026 [Candidatus Giovannonibacteria bacterium GW2011_GWA1_43_15]KKT21667.1 MAG: hypothetical protein UW05_C0005G0008 [Candidatus Giovannonibacteria bacterium GW2011_GWC2_43_8]KKT63393.1 MAG: hypothetical protein UW55_C0004G0026 [Candidatus Giovannonibacteria bacterium GW2011_GWA2_44_26]OGF58949.1 MAG: hypothetical protein A2652_03155 [Candidatus